MIQMFTTYIESLRSDERGQGLVEYALIIALISVALVAALVVLKGGIDDAFKQVSDALKAA